MNNQNQYFKSKQQVNKEKYGGIFLGFVITSILASILLIGGIIYWVIFVNKFTTWKDPGVGISMKYPKQWQPVKNVSGSIVAFLSPKETAMDIFQENVNISSQNLSATPMLLDEFTQIAIMQLEAVFNNIEIVESRDIVLDYKKAHRLSFRAESDHNMQVLLIWFMDGDQAYTITYMALESKYQEFLPLVEEMIDSFELKKKS